MGVTERVEPGGNMVRCGICGQYYDPTRHFGCPNCSSSSSALTEALYGGIRSDGRYGSPGYSNVQPVTEPVNMQGSSGRYGSPGYSNDQPVTEPVNMRGSYGGYGYFDDSGVGQRTQVADHIEKRPMEPTQIVGRGGFSPVVGWLVALNGPCRGTDYRILPGYNTIGRERGDICVHGDPTISKERDACINYDSRNRTFYVTHENGMNQTLLNDRAVRKEEVELFEYDVLTIGQTKLLFIPLCGDRFNW
ncbi:MAG: FHA domain-containing protein [Eubacteriales bacterium]|nr:FHA domain-containing protein [Eubacteriales bacterium]